MASFLLVLTLLGDEELEDGLEIDSNTGGHFSHNNQKLTRCDRLLQRSLVLAIRPPLCLHPFWSRCK